MREKDESSVQPKVLRAEDGKFLPGTPSPNPGGRPKGSVGMTTRIRQVLLRERNGKQVADILAEVLIQSAIKEPQKMWPFLKEFMDRDEGRTDKLDALHGMTIEDQAAQLRASLLAMDDTVPSEAEG